MVMKVRSFWKVLVGMVVSIFVGGGMAAKADARAKPTNKKVTVAQAPVVKAGEKAWVDAPKEGAVLDKTMKLFPISGVANVRFPAEGDAVERPAGTACTYRPAGSAYTNKPAGSAYTTKPGGVESESASTVILPEFSESIQIISIEQADLPSYQDKPVLIIDREEGSGYLRIPVMLPVGEVSLLKEYKAK